MGLFSNLKRDDGVKGQFIEHKRIIVPSYFLSAGDNGHE
jgi:hypothetical protein